MRHDERLTSMPHLCSCSAHAGNIRKIRYFANISGICQSAAGALNSRIPQGEASRDAGAEQFIFLHRKSN